MDGEKSNSSNIAARASERVDHFIDNCLRALLRYRFDAIINFDTFLLSSPMGNTLLNNQNREPFFKSYGLLYGRHGSCPDFWSYSRQRDRHHLDATLTDITAEVPIQYA